MVDEWKKKLLRGNTPANRRLKMHILYEAVEKTKSHVMEKQMVVGTRILLLHLTTVILLFIFYWRTIGHSEKKSSATE